MPMNRPAFAPHPPCICCLAADGGRRNRRRADHGNCFSVLPYDVARGFKGLQQAFLAQWKQTGGGDLVINQSHGGSSNRSARSSTGWKPTS